MSTIAKSNGKKAAKAKKPSKVGQAAEWADDRLGLATRREEADPQGLPRPLVVHAR